MHRTFSPNPTLRAPRRSANFAAMACVLALAAAPQAAQAMGLKLEPAPAHCGAQQAAPKAPPAAALQRLAGSQFVQGQKNIAWAWLGSPTLRYPHTALGSPRHAGSLHIISAKDGSEKVLTLPLHRVFEDLTVRLIDLDADGMDELVVVESDALKGAALVVFGLVSDQLVELARGPFAGSTFRWLNPVGAADFDGDGRIDLAAVVTPHIGGQLTFYHYRPPHLVPYASASDVSNHAMGSPEQQLAVIVPQPKQRPQVVVPDMRLAALYALRWAGTASHGRWEEIHTPLALPARIERLTPLLDAAQTVVGACALLVNRSWWRVMPMN